MATESDHISLANRNHQLLMHLIEVGGYPDWMATVAFYKALHVVEAVFASDMRRHSSGHSDRESTLNMTRYRGIARDYSHLSTASRIARYLESSAQAGLSRYTTFTDFMDETAVKQMIRSRLFGVEQESLAFLSNRAKQELIKVDPSKL